MGLLPIIPTLKALQRKFTSITLSANIYYPTSVATSPNGWTDRELCETWFRETFVPNALACRVNDKPVVLSADGHDSHETDKLKAVAYEYGIIVLAFPSKTTHKLQPLDVGVFSSLQRKWTAHCGQRVIDGIKINRYNFVPEYMEVRKKAITPELIKKSFSRTGIYPFNPDIFTDKDFAPSRATSRDAHLPPSYPPEVPMPRASSLATPMDSLVDCEDGIDGRIMEDLAMDEDKGEDDDGSDEDGSDKEFYYDPALDGTRKAFPDRGSPHFSSLTTTSSEITASENSSESTGAITIPEDPTDTVPAMQVDGCAPMPVHGCTLFTGPMLPLVSFAQYSEMSTEDGWKYLCQVHAQGQALVTTATTLVAQLESSNTHCTMARYEISTLREQQVSKKNGKARSMKFSARWVAHPDMKDAFESERKEKEEKASREAEATAKKKAENEARTSRIDHDVVLRTFESPLSAYKRKDDFVTIARAFQIAVESKDTIATLTKKIRARMDENPAIAENPRFSALFGEPSRRGQRSKRVAPCGIDQEDQSNMPALELNTPSGSSHAGPSTVYSQSYTPASFSHFHLPGPNASEPPPSWLQPHSNYFEQFYPPMDTTYSSLTHQHATPTPQQFHSGASGHSYTFPSSSNST